MNRTIVFIHGGRVTPACWEPFVSFFESKGNRCLAPTWPGKDRSVEAIRADPSPLAGLGIGEIVDHYDRIVRSLGEPPILIGDSIAGEADRAMPPALVHRMYRAHSASPARTDLRSFPGRTHWLIAQDGWEEVAQGCLDWIESLSPGTMPNAKPGSARVRGESMAASEGLAKLA